MRIRLALPIFCTVALLLRCSSGDEPSGTAQKLTSDDIDTALDEGIDAMVELLTTEQGSGSSAALTDVGDCNFAATCSPVGTQAKIERQRSCTRERSVLGVQRATTMEDSIVQNWQAANGASIGCAASGKAAAIDLQQAGAVGVSVEASYASVRAMSRQVTRGQVTRNQNLKRELTGTRSVTFSNLTASQRTKTLSATETRNISFDSDKQTLKVKNANLVIHNTVSAGSITAHRIESGTQTLEWVGKGTLTKQFSNLSWGQIGGSFCCVPLNGKLSAGVVNADGSRGESFELDFSANAASTTCPDSATYRTASSALAVKFSTLVCDLSL